MVRVSELEDASLQAWNSDRSSLLAIESATSSVSVVLRRGEELLAEGTRPAARQHAETLLPLVDEVLGRSGLTLDELDGYAISIGPGTFTSLRIGLATVKGLAFASDTPVAAVSTLAALAHAGAAALPGTQRCVSLLDARREEVYAGAFATDTGDALPLSELLPEAVYRIDQLAQHLREPIALVGEGATRLAPELAREAGFSAAPPCTDVAPHARSVAVLGARLLAAGRGIRADALVPRYLRRAQAEEDRIAGA